MLLEKRDAQRILLVIYFVVCIFFLILSSRVEQYPLYYNIYCIMTPIVAYLLTKISQDNYKFQMYLMTSFYLAMVVLYGIYYQNPGSLQDGFITVACIVSLYFDFSINLYCLMFTALYYAFWIVYDYDLLIFGRTPMELGVRITLLIIAQVFLMTLVSSIKRSKQTLEQKSQSTEDLLQIVEIKKKEAVAASQTKADFLASMSHEIRTPMNAIVGMTEMILRDDINPGVRENARNIKSAGNALLSIVNDILDFSKIESGKMEIINVRYQLTSVINDIINIISVRMVDKDLDLVVNIDPRIPSDLVGDEIRIRQILLNLLNNAVKFTSEGYIALNVSFQPISSDMCLLHFDVADTGMGIREEDKQRLFNSFQRLDTRQNRAVEGTGLGLSICKRLMDLMGGTISVDSTYGKGSTFSFELHQYIAKSKPLASLPDGQNEHILYFDEKGIFRDSARTDLQRLGVSARFASKIRDLDPASNAQYSYFFVSKSLFDEYAHEIREFITQHGNPKIVLMIDKNELASGYKDVLVVHRPVYCAVFASVLQDKPVRSMESDEFQESFIAPNVHILVVDDNAVNLKVVKGLLEPYQMHVDTANSGARCLEILRDGKEQYDLIFMDHMMPEMDGIDTLRLLRGDADAYYSKIPVVALTANAVSGVREMFFKEGFQDYVSKPIELSQLEKVLKNQLPEDMIIRKQHTVQSAPRSGEGEVILRGVDTSRGLLNCGNSLENYIDLLKVVYEDGLNKVERLRELAEAKDYANYGIEAHALKSVAASIGATELSEQAKEHEFANYDQRFEFIDARYKDLLSQYQSLLDDIGLELQARGLLTDSETSVSDGPKPLLPEEEWIESVVSIRNSIDDFDADLALQKLDWLLSYDVGQDRELILRRTRNCLCDFQYDEASENLKNLLGE